MNMSTIFYVCLIILIIYMFSSIAFNISMFKRINHLYSYINFLKTKLYEDEDHIIDIALSLSNKEDKSKWIYYCQF